MENEEIIELVHGEGGAHTAELIENLFYKEFNNKILLEDMDSALFKVEKGTLAFTTDSFVVKPVFFSGGDIGKLAVCGTVNDLIVSGGKPLYLSASFIIEEGFKMRLLEKIVRSMSETAEKAGVKIVTGDTKVVEKGMADGIFINTSGIGCCGGYKPKKIEGGDKILITGGIAEHGTAIAIERYKISVKSTLKSDCSPLTYLLPYIEKYSSKIKLMKDPTRGGLAVILNEIAKKNRVGMHLFENKIPIKEEVQIVNDILGIDPLYLASEGRMILIVESAVAEEMKEALVQIENCNDSEIIGEVTGEEKFVYIENSFGGKRIVANLESSILPRIC